MSRSLALGSGLTSDATCVNVHDTEITFINAVVEPKTLYQISALSFLFAKR